MKARLTFRTGDRAGLSVVLDKTYATVGRHPYSDLRFGPDGDLEVSSRHAALLLRGDVYLLRDLGSTNGTFVNGMRLVTDHVLADYDQVQFGLGGPVVEFRREWDTVASTEPPPMEGEGRPPRRTVPRGLTVPTVPGPGAPSSASDLQREVARTNTIRRAMVLAIAVLAAVIAAVLAARTL